MAALETKCPGCRRSMREERVESVVVDLCDHCSGLWFDATELNEAIRAILPLGGQPPEDRMPDRGVATRSCPRCAMSLRTAGWNGLVLDRCPKCRGLFVEAREWDYLKQHEAPYRAQSFEADLRDAMVAGGSALIVANGVLWIIIRLWR